MKKYRINISKEGTIANDRTGKVIKIYQIEALIDIPDIGVKAGDIGGFIEDESNLSHEGNCWVFPDSIVAMGSLVAGDALIKGGSHVLGGSRVFDRVIVKSGSKLFNTLLGKDCYCEDSRLVSCTFYEGVRAVDSNVVNMTAWTGQFKKANLNSKQAQFWIPKGSACEVVEGTIYHTSKRVAKIEVPFKLKNAKLSSLKTFSLKSPLHIENMRNLGSLHITTLKSHLPGFINELKGKTNMNLMFQKGTIALKDSKVNINGFLPGTYKFENCIIDTYGNIKRKVSCKSELSFYNVKLLEMASLVRLGKGNMELRDIVLDGDTCHEY